MTTADIDAQRDLPESESFGTLFERVTVMHSTDRWAATANDLSTVLGRPKFSDATGWATWDVLSISDESEGPAWSLLARTADLTATVERARSLGWDVGDVSRGGHEVRVPLRSPNGLSVIAYTPASAS
ncbi:hypothetical protein [Rhodococcus sp. B50]|uniref:hypothetical protein n=1 Tax=Rhodococcus sp. B50 TaxID=2682847 RepID=UPI001BD5C1B0|nr:hypothetical protein [Rhodococcus sp. B50]MBS9375212.1 hypothetical protein [Rhodococcus sp. B50]